MPLSKTAHRSESESTRSYRSLNASLLHSFNCSLTAGSCFIVFARARRSFPPADPKTTRLEIRSRSLIPESSSCNSE